MKKIVPFFLACGATALAQPQSLDQQQMSPANDDTLPAFSLTAAWQNRYLTEGRKIFGTNGAFSGQIEANYDPFVLSIWMGFSDGNAQREMDASLAYQFAGLPAGIELALGVSHITDWRGPDDYADWDLFIEAGSELFLGIEWQALAYYGINVTGSYVEAGLARPFELCNGLELTLASHLGANFGYVADGHDGLDHHAVEIRLESELAPGLRLGAHVGYYTPIGRNPDKHPGDEDLFQGLHFGLGASYQF